LNQQFEGFDTVNFQERDGLFRMEQQAFNNEQSMEQFAINNSYKLGGSNGTPKPKRHGQVRVSIEDLRQDQHLLNTNRKCQVDPSCQEMAISTCSKKAYRGCTMAYCNSHSG